jgi:hypothetical protein
MSFVFPFLLGGLVLIGVPILLHLIMRQKPKQLPFPAFRFLLRRHKTNLRKLRLRHLLLLALRVLLLAAIFLALSRPKITGGLFLPTREGPVAAVLLFDTSYSMGYRIEDKAGRRNLLDEAKRRARELLGEFHDDSKVIVLDTARANNQWLSPDKARKRIDQLKLRPDNFSVTDRLVDAYKLFEAAAVDESLKHLPRFLYVFSDRTQGSWDNALLAKRQEDADRVPPSIGQLRELRERIPPVVELIKPLQERLKINGGPALADKLEQLRAVDFSSDDLAYPDSPAAKLIPTVRAQVREILRQAKSQPDTGAPAVREYRDKLMAGLQDFLHELKGALEIFVDVGVKKPMDLAVEDLIPTDGDRERPRQAFSAGQEMQLHAKVRAAGATYRGVVVECLVDGKKVKRRQIDLKAENAVWVVFRIDCRKLDLGLHQVEVRVPSRDLLAFNDQRFVTFEVRKARKVLFIADNPKWVRDWKLAAEVDGKFRCTVLTPDKAAKLKPEALGKYHAVCLFEIAKPSRALWKVLKDYVAGGRNLAVIPPRINGNKEDIRKAYNQPAAQELLAGKLVTDVRPKVGVVWDWQPRTFQHPMLKPFRKWANNANIDFIKAPRRAFRFWQVKPKDKSSYVLVRYKEKKNRPAILESSLKKKGKKQRGGRVLVFTAALGVGAGWTNYSDILTSFIVVLPDLTFTYLAGSDTAVNHTYLSGQLVVVTLAPKPGRPPYSLEGPNLEDASSTLEPPPQERVLRIKGAIYPGNYPLMNQDNQRIAAFSVNVLPSESDLTRVPVDQITALFGPDTVLPVGTDVKFLDALKHYGSQPVELLPFLLVLLLILLAVENLLSNKFYRRAPEEQPSKPLAEGTAP